jgi:hypothetical protein
MGFRRMTFFPDRPDNMATFQRVRIEADPDYPVLLSNGNLVEEGEIKGRKYAVWTDPWPKPSYLFCIVAGNLGSIQDSFVTQSGRKVQLQLFSEPNNVHKLHYAMDALKRSMRWDETRFGLEYDLDLYNIVAVESFNMGAMENKGLNVFNTAYVLADEKTASDVDFERVEGVIGKHATPLSEPLFRIVLSHVRIASPRILSQLDWKSRYLSRLVPVDAQRRPYRLSRSRVFGRHELQGCQSHRERQVVASTTICRRRRAHGASHSTR